MTTRNRRCAPPGWGARSTPRRPSGQAGTAQARGPPASAHTAAPAKSAPTPLPKGMTAAQVANADIIVKTGRRMASPNEACRSRWPPRCRSPGSATSTTANRDSLGLFQQRPSQGWEPEAR